MTLAEISKMNPSSYRVTDNELLRGKLLTNSGRIEISGNGWYKECTRKFAKKYGICRKEN